VETKQAKLATRAQVAEYLGVPAGSLAQWAYRSVGPAYYVVGRHAMYRWSDVEQWLDTCKKNAS
jgi:hypothetical protein